MLAKTFSAALSGVDATIVEIQAALQPSTPAIVLTGLVGDVVKESRERVRVSLVHLGFDVPSSRVLIHLSPASSKKQGSQFDLAIAMSLLLAEGLLAVPHLSSTAFLGELSLDGKIKAVACALSLMQKLVDLSCVETVIVPKENFREAALLNHKKIRLAGSLSEVLNHFSGEKLLPSVSPLELVPPRPRPAGKTLDSVIGQGIAKRALQIAVAGRHHLLMMGPPGVGKSLLAQCANELLPELSAEEQLAVAKNYGFHSEAWPRFRLRPFRSPHHSISSAALLGGGSGLVVPGEVTLAHTGILFLDEFPEFRKDVLEGLREPLQSGVLHLHRVGHALSLPARFTLIAAMNPCPCGHALSLKKRCQCPMDKRRAYQRKISGPIWDRLDLVVPLSFPRAQSEPESLSHQALKQSVQAAVERQEQRYGPQSQGLRNGDDAIDIKHAAFALAGDAKTWFETMAGSEQHSYRALHKTVRVARTLADLAGVESVGLEHLREAWTFRATEGFAPGLSW